MEIGKTGCELDIERTIAKSLQLTIQSARLPPWHAPSESEMTVNEFASLLRTSRRQAKKAILKLANGVIEPKLARLLNPNVGGRWTVNIKCRTRPGAMEIRVNIGAMSIHGQARALQIVAGRRSTKVVVTPRERHTYFLAKTVHSEIERQAKIRDLKMGEIIELAIIQLASSNAK